MRPIGGYFELECGHSSLRHSGLFVNSGRNALRLIVRKLKISKIHVPSYTCPVVYQALVAEGCVVEPYDIDRFLMPAKRFPTDDFILVNDYFGVTGRSVCELATQYANLVVDNAQAYFADPVGRATFYSPRKFFGLPDGGIAVFNRDEIEASELERDISVDRVSHLLKRHDLGANEGYADFRAASQMLVDLPVRSMSRLTRALMGNLDERTTRERRVRNFNYLYSRLPTAFPIRMTGDAVPLVFPYVTSDPNMRQKLILNKIFVATYWPNCAGCEKLAQTILPLPIDQRYDEEDMERIIEVIGI